MNRKLIRPNLAEVKSREPLLAKEAEPENVLREKGSEKFVRSNSENKFPRQSNQTESSDGANRRKMPPTAETNAETYYYKKQIDSHTVMVIVMDDGEEIEGTIEWYDLNALKVNRKDEPNVMLFKNHIKYMYKADEED